MLLFYQKEGLIMCATMPIKGSKKLTMFRNYYKNVQYNPRNYALIVLGLNSALRISDILSLRWRDVYQNSKKKYRSQAFRVIKKAAIYCGLDQGGQPPTPAQDFWILRMAAWNPTRHVDEYFQSFFL